MCTQPVVLDSTLRSSEAMEFGEALRAKIAGQEEAVQAMVDLYQVFCAGLNSPGRPIGSLLFLGPTGSGKTRIVEAAAEILFGDRRAVITELMHGGMGFIQPEDLPMKGLDMKVARTAVEAARRNFSPEFMNRLDKIVVFHPLNREQLGEVLEIELR